MFNESIKQKWINEKESQVILPQGALKRAFEKIELFEKELEKDLCDFNVVEVLNFYQTINSNTPETLNVINSYFRQYTDYCIKHNISESDFNAYENFQLSSFLSLVNNFAKDKKIMSRKQILEYCSQLPNYVDKFTLLGLFEGIRGEFFTEFVYIKISDIDEENNIIHLQSRDIKVSKELINFALESYKEEGYSGVNGNARSVRSYIPSDLIIKDFRASQVDEQSKKRGRKIQTKVMNIFSELDIADWINSNDVVNSGKIHWLKEKYSPDEIKGIFYMTEFSDEEKKEKFKKQFDIDTIRTNWYIKFERYLL